MMTCRLLCALLVLALCCCPSVCVTASGDGHDSRGPELSQNGKSEIEDNGKPSGSAGAAGLPGTDPATDPLKGPDSQNPGSFTQQEKGDTGGSGSLSGPANPSAEGDTGTLKEIVEEADPQGILGTAPATREHPNTGSQAPITNEDRGDTSTQEAPSGNITATDQTDTNVDGSAETTTTNRMTDTTTTTTAPEAPSTTTTEARTTTTTGAPSRPREIDGSLSSSAWVCAPLLLAVSALAYTTPG
ncbi:mucin TcMUCII, putative [Trypanosoma cruzi marinkellei]|uniref:Mucin TcMUCII, putative n=1 Tax=Trypanosoma cruzi marinkellei TaxID=85056 RepID=K2N316_TRYCR|nr:mucin TcMUCII, putative [Trypanosoma cruzi marinkellei]